MLNADMMGEKYVTFLELNLKALFAEKIFLMAKVETLETQLQEMELALKRMIVPEVDKTRSGFTAKLENIPKGNISYTSGNRDGGGVGDVILNTDPPKGQVFISGRDMGDETGA